MTPETSLRDRVVRALEPAAIARHRGAIEITAGAVYAIVGLAFFIPSFNAVPGILGVLASLAAGAIIAFGRRMPWAAYAAAILVALFVLPVGVPALFGGWAGTPAVLGTLPAVAWGFFAFGRWGGPPVRVAAVPLLLVFAVSVGLFGFGPLGTVGGILVVLLVLGLAGAIGIYLADARRLGAVEAHRIRLALEWSLVALHVVYAALIVRSNLVTALLVLVAGTVYLTYRRVPWLGLLSMCLAAVLLLWQFVFGYDMGLVSLQSLGQSGVMVETTIEVMATSFLRVDSFEFLVLIAAGIVSVFGASAYGSAWVRWAPIALTSIGLAGVAWLGVFGTTVGFYGVPFVTLLVLVAWGAGWFARTRREAAAKLEVAQAGQEQLGAEVLIEQERNRVARDVHDIVAHSLAVVIAQADGARYAVQKHPEAAVPAFVAISEAARGALGEVRDLLSELRHHEEPGPQPGIDAVPALLDGFRESGLVVERTDIGPERPLTSSGELALYRVLQEALTNALRHGDAGAPVAVEFDWEHAGLALTVVNRLREPVGEGDEAVASSPDRRGHGLPGMRERVTLAGGTFSAGALAGQPGRFRLRAVLPLASAPEASGEDIAPLDAVAHNEETTEVRS